VAGAKGLGGEYGQLRSGIFFSSVAPQRSVVAIAMRDGMALFDQEDGNTAIRLSVALLPVTITTLQNR
jgi:hypothetical protein